jgi:hypothetical protein
MVSDHVVFTSSEFAIQPGEDEETNPRIYGKSLAAWVAGQLSKRGVTVERIVAEDFGRCVIVRSKPYMLWLACANLDSERTRWQMYIALEQNPVRRLFSRVDPAPELTRLREHLREIVSEIPGVSHTEWQGQ